MTEPTLALQRAIRLRLVATPDVTELVPASSIVEGPRRPDQFPSIILGEAQTVNNGITYSRQHVTAYLDLHVWTRGDGLIDHRDVVGAITSALQTKPTVEGIDLVDLYIQGTRFMRDPTGDNNHAVVSIEAVVGIRT